MSTAPLEGPVVPPVYSSAAGSCSGFTSATAVAAADMVMRCPQRTTLAPLGTGGHGRPCVLDCIRSLSGARTEAGNGR